MGTLSSLATYRIGKGISLVIARGSVLDFSSKHDAAIVNAANEGCLGGGGVDGAISNAGGRALFKARLALPILEDEDDCDVRCLTGDAKLSGPGKFGRIRTNHVIHAVGPNYNYSELEEYSEADTLLKSAYQNTLKIADEAGLQEVCFSLLAAGIFKGKRSLKDILELGVESICSWAEQESDEMTTIKTVVMCAFQEKEANALLEITASLGLQVSSAEQVPAEEEADEKATIRDPAVNCLSKE